MKLSRLLMDHHVSQGPGRLDGCHPAVDVIEGPASRRKLLSSILLHARLGEAKVHDAADSAHPSIFRAPL